MTLAFAPQLTYGKIDAPTFLASWTKGKLWPKGQICSSKTDWAHEYLWEICAEHKMHLQGVSTVNINKACVSVINDQYSIPIKGDYHLTMVLDGSKNIAINYFTN